jgi:hypothetical protein
MQSDSKGNEEKRRLDRQLDEELKATFPASDAPTVTRSGGTAIKRTRALSAREAADERRRIGSKKR